MTSDPGRGGFAASQRARPGEGRTPPVGGNSDNRRVVMRLVFRGRCFGPEFLDFAADRARRFSLGGSARLGRPGEMTVVAAGPAALIDMLEIACMLGPVDALVDEIERREEPAASAPPEGFAILG